MRAAPLLAAGALLIGCATTDWTPRTVDCGRLTPVPNPSGRIELVSHGVSVLPPQADRWCMSPVNSQVFAFYTHPLMGTRLETAPSLAEQAHTFGILVIAGPPPKNARLDTPDDFVAVARQLMLGERGRVRIVESTSTRDTSLGAECVRFDSILEEHDNPRARGAVFVVVNRDSYLCRHPHAPSPTLVLFGASERYIRGTVSPPLLLDTLSAAWVPAVRSIQFLRPR
jgi:hypothetical protein